MKPSRRMALVAAAAVLTLSACGSSGSPGTASDPTTAVSERPAPEVIELASGAATTNSSTRQATAGAEMAADAATSMMAAAVILSYAGEFPELATEAPSWYFAPGGAVTVEQVKALAAAFGLEGEPTELPADQGGGWLVGSADYTGPSLTVSTSSMNDWWYNPGPSSAVTTSIGCAGEARTTEESATDAPADTLAVDVPAETVVVDPGFDAGCATPTPPAGVPTAEEAEALARELFAGVGADLSQYEFETSADEWGAYVTAYLLLDGYRTPVTFGVGYGGDAALQWASGVLATPQAGPSYPLRGAAAGLEALQTEQNAWMGGVSDLAGVKDAVVEPAPGAEAGSDAGVSSDPGVSTDAVEPAVEPAVGAPEPMSIDPCVTTMDTPVASPDSSGEAAPEVTIGLMPIECGPAPLPMDPVEVTLTGVRPDLTMVWAADGTIWLLPAYTFTTDDGAMYTVIAVDDAYLQAPAG